MFVIHKSVRGGCSQCFSFKFMYKICEDYAQNSIVYTYYVQWNLSNSDTLGTTFQVFCSWQCPDWDHHHKLILEVQISEVPL